jgi:hypothetical protein
VIDLPCATTDDIELLMTDSTTALVRRCELMLDACDETIQFEVGSYTNKALVTVEGELLFGELAILRLAQKQGWDGVWLDTYHGDKKWRDMPHVSEPVSIPAARGDLLDRIRDRHGRRGGAWDVFVWKNDEVGFLEAKTVGDGIRPNQRTWLAAALAEGVPPSAFTIVDWVAEVG